jgi:hypothetical protein
MWKPDWTRRDRSHLYIVPREKYLEQETLTYALAPSAKIVDWRAEFLNTVRPTQKRMGLTIDGEIKRLQKIVNTEKRIFSIINTEYMLAGFDEERREQFWLSLWKNFPNLSGILLFTVINAPAFLPDKLTLADWKSDNRLFYADGAGNGNS